MALNPFSAISRGVGRVFGRGGNAAAGVADSAAGNAVNHGLGAKTAIGVNNGVGKINRGIGSINGRIAWAAQIGGMVAFAAKIFGGKKSEDGEISGNAVGRSVMKAADTLEKPREFIEQKTVKDVAHGASSLFGEAQKRAVAKWGKAEDLKGNRKKIVETLGGAAKKAESIEGSVISKGAHALDRLGAPVGDFVERRGGGILSAVSAHRSAKAKPHLTAAQEALKAGTEAASQAELSGVSSAFEVVKGLLGKKASDVTDKEIGDAFQGIKKGLAAAKKAGADEHVLGELTKSADALSEAVVPGLKLSQSSERFADLPDSIRHSSQKLGNASVKNVLAKGALITDTAVQLTGTSRGMAERTHTLKELYKDLTGETKVSTFKVLFSKKVPDAIKEARGHIFKEFGPRAVLNIAQAATTYLFVNNNNAKVMIGSAVLGAAGHAIDGKSQQYALLPLYEALNQQASIDAGQYAAFITAASPGARSAGMQNEYVIGIAMQYEQEGIRPSEILKEIESGEFNRRAAALKNANMEQQAAQGSAQGARPGATGAEATLPLGSHADNLRSKPGGASPATPSH